ncbi:MAG: T9SS type A sorting domain-containing protein [Bacteroidia bacterium]|nr:T9SS type A sorting domain-containing protein [Bacteroidia bacterium]
MRKIITLFSFVLLTTLVGITVNGIAQGLQLTSVNLINDLHPSGQMSYRQSNGLGKTSACGDTIYYPWYKATQFNAIALNSATSGSIFAQWYDAPQAITVSGFDFYGWQSANTNQIINITCRMYAAGIDSMPTGSPLASVVVPVDSTFGGGLLSAMRRVATFTNAVTTNAPYVLTIETSSSVNVSIITNSWSASPPNGRNEWLSSVKIGSNFIRSYNVNVGGPVFDADFIFLPHVAYSLSADFTISDCNTGGNLIQFTNTSSPVLFNKFYNFRAFQNVTSTTINYLNYSSNWNYGDTTPSKDTILGLKIYAYNVPHTTTLRSTVVGWRVGCVDTKSKVVGTAPNPPNVSSNSPLCVGATLQLTADSIPDATYRWTGPNGFTSSLRNPTIPNAGISAMGNYSAVAIVAGCTSVVASTYVSVNSTPSATSNGPICAGQTLNLSATQFSGATYSWTGPNSFTSSLQAPSITNATTTDSGTYYVTITATGCGTMGPYSVYAPVNKVPAAPTISTNSPICTGDNLNLTASNYSGGTYIWTGPNNFSSSQQNPIRTNANTSFAGTYNVVLSSNGCSSQMVSTNVVVNISPDTPAVTSNSPLCVNQTLSLTASTIPNATYAWSGPNNFTSSLQNPIRDSLKLLDAGNYSVIATVNGCPSKPGVVNVQITSLTPTPVATNNGPLCPGQNLQLGASTINGATYSWTGPNNFTSTQQNPVINNVSSTEAGIYSVTATTSGCGTSAAGNTTLVVNTLPPAPTVSNNGPLCDGETINLTASGVTGATYAWSGPDGFTSTAQNPSITNANAAKAGNYSVQVTVSGCGTSPTSTTNVKVHRIPARPSVSGTGSVCENDSIKLFGNGIGVGVNATYAWTGPNNFTSSDKNPVISSSVSANTGTYNLIVTDSGCSSLSGTTTVTVKANPASPTVTTNSPICEGANAIFTASTIANATYSWTGPNNFASSSRNPVISGATKNATGSYEVVAIVNGCKSVPASAAFIVNELPTQPIVTDSFVKCVGNTLNLTAKSDVGVAYSWSGPDGFTSTLQNPTVTNLTLAKAGDYTVNATSSTCASLPSVSNVLVNSIPTAPVLSSNPISGDVCVGDSVQLFANYIAGATYQWIGPAGFSSTEQRPIIRNVSTANSGNYSATITKVGCTSSNSEIAIGVIPLPTTSEISGPTSAYTDSMATYSVVGSASSNFAWVVSSGGSIKTGAGTSTITVKWNVKGSSELVKVTETSSTNCKGAEKSLAVNVQHSVGLNEVLLNNSRISLFPNPVTDKVFLYFDVLKPVNAVVSVINVLGQQVASVNQSVLNNQSVGINVPHLSRGIYYAVITVDGESKSIKFSVE